MKALKSKYIKPLYLTVLLATLCNSAHAADISVVDVKRNITLSDNDPVYKDYYINAGDGTDLRKNLVVQVKRKIHVKDQASKNIGDFETTVGTLKIIQVGNKVSVAREFKLQSREEDAVIEQLGIMAGDRVELSGAFIDNSAKPAKSKYGAEPAKPESTEVAAVVIETTTPTPETAKEPTPTDMKTPATPQPTTNREPAKDNSTPAETNSTPKEIPDSKTPTDRKSVSIPSV